MAPKEQVKVPLLIWLAPRFASAMAFKPHCLAGQKDVPLSHDTLFHTALSVLPTKRSVKGAGLDLTSTCSGEDQA